MKFPKVSCPYVGCYFSAAVLSDDKAGFRDAADKVRKHRHQTHQGHDRITSFIEGKSWEWEFDL